MRTLVGSGRVHSALIVLTSLGLVAPACSLVFGTGGLTGGADAVSDDAGAANEASSSSSSGSSSSGSGSTSSSGSASSSSSSSSGGASDSGSGSSSSSSGSSSSGSGSSSGGAVDAGPTLTNPIQIDVSTLFNANSVVTTTSGGVALTPIDGVGGSQDDDFPTQSEAKHLSSTARGLPDNAFFASNGKSIPDVQLAWNNSRNVENSLVVLASANTRYTFTVPPAAYSQLQIYATGGNGNSTLTVTLTYSDNTTGTKSVAVPDWCSSAALGAGQYKLASATRVQNGTLNGQNPDLACSIYALDLNPNRTKTLTSVAFADSGSSVSYFVFYGAVAW